MNVAIIGLGLIGGSVGLKLKEVGFANRLIGVDVNQDNAERAVELGLVDEVLAFSKAIPMADLIIVAVPVTIMAEILPTVLDQVHKNAVVMDLGSTKEDICLVLNDHPKRNQFVAAHPISGTENSGPDAAFASLFEDKTGILCDVNDSSKEAFELANRCLHSLGMNVIQMDSKSHDLHIALSLIHI